MPEWDSIFDQWRSGNVQAYDPSLIQIFIPDYFFQAKQMGQGILPLWNSLSGFGYPFLADIQSSVFAPLRLIFDLAPNLYTYNLYLLGELFVAAVSSYFLARRLDQSRLAALFASTCYTFCPYNLWYLELNLGSAHSLFPLTALAFVHAAKTRNLLSAVMAGISCSLLIVSGHPECAFFGITLSSLLMFLIIFMDRSFTSLKAKFFSSIALLAGAATTTVFLSAPILFPFLEYLMNAESYKYGSAYSTPVTWNSILFNLANPAVDGASPFLGITAAMLIPYACYMTIARRRNCNTLSIASLSIITFLIVSQLGPIQQLFAQGPLTAIITRYALPYLLLLLSLFAAYGLQALEDLLSQKGTFKRGSTPEQRQMNWVAGAIEFFAFALVPAIGLLLFAKSEGHNAAFLKLCDFDAMLPLSRFTGSVWRRDLATVIGSGALVLTIILMQLKKRHSTSTSKFFSCPNINRALLLTCPAFILILQLISQGLVARHSMPAQNKFFYPELEITKFIADPLYRSISLREHVFRPATNAIYGVNFLQVHNPLFPKRFLEFMKAAGASVDTFNQKFESVSSPLLSLSSVRYILTIDPIAASAGLRQIYAMPNQIKVIENTKALPRLYLAKKSLELADAAAVLKKIQEPNFAPREYVVLESDAGTGSSATPAAASDASGAGEIIEFEDSGSNYIRAKYKSQQPSWMVLNDIYYPGWTALIDGQKAPIRRANYAFRAIPVPAGEHRVEFIFDPMSFKLGLAAFSAFSSGILLYFWAHRRRRVPDK